MSQDTKRKLVQADHNQEWMMSAPVFIVCVADISCRIADDYELVVRSFLHTKFTHIPVCCYMQRFDGEIDFFIKNLAYVRFLLYLCKLILQNQ